MSLIVRLTQSNIIIAIRIGIMVVVVPIVVAATTNLYLYIYILHMNIDTCIYVYMYIWLCVCLLARVCVSSYIYSVFVCIYYMYFLSHIYTYVCTYVNFLTHDRTSVQIHVYLSTYTYVCV